MNKKILTVANQKGGVAKSSTCAQVAGFIAGQQKKVLLVDLDPQCNLSAKFLEMKTSVDSRDTYNPPPHPNSPNGEIYTSALLFTGGDWDAYPTKTPNLFILPASSSHFNFRGSPAESIENLKYFMSHESIWDTFDLIIFDTPPAKNLWSEAALTVATHVLIPCPMEKSPYEGLLAIMQFIHMINEPLPVSESAQIIGILPTLHRTSMAIHKEFLERLKAHPLLSRFATPFEIRWRPVFQEVDMVSKKAPYQIKRNKKTQDAYVEWEKLGLFVIEKMGL